MAGDSNPHSADQKHQTLKFGAFNRSATTLPQNHVYIPIAGVFALKGAGLD